MRHQAVGHVANGQMRMDSIHTPVKDRPYSEIMLVGSKAVLNLPQLAVLANQLSGRQLFIATGGQCPQSIPTRLTGNFVSINGRTALRINTQEPGRITTQLCANGAGFGEPFSQPRERLFAIVPVFARSLVTVSDHYSVIAIFDHLVTR